MASKLSVVFRRFASSSPAGPSAVAGEHSGGAQKWKMLTVLVALPSVGVAYVNAFVFGDHHEEPPEFHKYEHLRTRTKPFPWGDGNHTLFHNKHATPLPDGYEE
ncbi:hypothetical protein SNE40_003606 [Patella caerulea]|uniref:Cytochrome c oxidase polypeptide VIa n=1 Tax=Patella caerulea TaxID=87958 RepID=A0AAN8K872_PATCE